LEKSQSRKCLSGKEFFMSHDLNNELERLRLRKSAATARGGQAFLRLLQLAETHDSGQVARIARFLAATFDGEAYAFDLFELRTVDETIADDMLACIDALRWGQADLHTLVPEGLQRVLAVIDLWGLTPPPRS
jgi:hypothetical protein